MKRDASPGSMHDAGCLGLVHWDDPEGWYGEGGGRRVQDGEHMYIFHILNKKKLKKQNHYKKKKKKEMFPWYLIIFLKRSLDFPILLLSSISLHWSLRKVFLSLLAILWNSAFKWVYVSFSPLPLTSLQFTATCKVSSDNHLPFCISFPWGWCWSLPSVQC